MIGTADYKKHLSFETIVVSPYAFCHLLFTFLIRFAVSIVPGT